MTGQEAWQNIVKKENRKFKSKQFFQICVDSCPLCVGSIFHANHSYSWLAFSSSRSTILCTFQIAGEHDTTRRLESTTLRVRAKPYRFNKHWSYKFDQEKGAWYDFALIELSTPVDFNRYPHIRPVCLPDRAEIDYIDQIATVSGWGLQNVDYKKYAKEGIIKGVGYGRAKILKKLDVK